MTQLTEYERKSISKLDESIHHGKWSNEAMVQLIELCFEYLNPITLQQYADENKISYNAAKKRRVSITILKQKYVLNNY